jgi:MFS family permease
MNNNSVEDTNTFHFYLGYIIILAIIYIIVILLVDFIKNHNEEANKFNASLDYYAVADNGVQIIHDKLTHEQRALRFKFLLASSVIKAAIWIKAPYTFALFNRVHGFTRSEVGLIEALGSVTSLVLSPLFGSLCDMYGRKKFCVLYCLCTILHICLRVTGDRTLAYFASVVTGVCSVLIDTSFEPWVIYEANTLFDDDPLGEKQKNSFLRELFSKQVNIDCLISIILTGVATYLYMRFDIFYPFYVAIGLTIIALGIILFTWNENNLRDNKTFELNQTFYVKLVSSWEHIIENKALLCLGTLEGFFKVSLFLFLFIWTPLLEETCKCLIHPGAIFTCFMIARLIGSELFSVTIT